MALLSTEKADSETLGRPRHRGRRRRWVMPLVAVAAVAIVAPGVAWVAAPRPTDPRASVLARLRAAGGRFVPVSRVSADLRSAVVATEDERFFRHHGIDVIGIARAVAYDVGHLSAAEGASTITEQLGKILYLGGNDRSPWRKLEDAVLALRIESELPKDEILGLYLNCVYFGEGAYGIGAASERFFGVPPSRLGLGRASLLAGLIQAPSAYDPSTQPSAARYRQADVLSSMVRNGDITQARGEAVLARPLPLASGRTLPPLSGVGLAPGPHVSGPLLEIGLALLGLCLAGLLLVRRRWPIPGSVVGALAAAGGLFLIARSVRVG